VQYMRNGIKRSVGLTLVVGSTIAFWLTCCPAFGGQGTGNADRASLAKGSPSGEELWLKANGLRLKGRIYRSAQISAHPLLIVVLHGDLLGVRAVPASTYHYMFAKAEAAKMDDVVIVAMLRPGYRDETGEYSEGAQGLTTGDNYTPDVVDAIAQAVEQLKAKFHPARTILAGHSGGAAIAGDVLGRWPSEVDSAFMVSCPCDLTAWRKHMQELQGGAIWSAPVKSLSPIDLAGSVLPSERVRLLVGGQDPVAPPDLSKRYAALLRARGVDVSVTVIPGLEHDILLEAAVLDALQSLVKTLRKDENALGPANKGIAVLAR
jgi:pimeloyl-ACP methyl ester carboxylesterase